jgi:hypothetical protein
MLVIYVVATVALSLVLAGPKSQIDWVHILLAYLTTHLNILVALDGLSQLENIIPMLKHFGSGGPVFILSSDTLE